VFKKQPNLQLAFTFAALGQAAAIQHGGSRSVDVRCGGQGTLGHNERSLVDCPLQLEGLIGKGSVATGWSTSAPAQGDCTLRVALVRGSRPASNELVINLKETPGP
jgi:hypothetical protein